MLGYLRVENGPDQGRIFDILKGMTLSIGRGPKSDTQLKDLSVSRMHCELGTLDGHMTLLDQEGSSGTYVNGAKISKHVLKSGDTIKIGDTHIKVHLSGIEDASTVAGALKPLFQASSTASVLRHSLSPCWPDFTGHAWND